MQSVRKQPLYKKLHVSCSNRAQKPIYFRFLFEPFAKCIKFIQFEIIQNHHFKFKQKAQGPSVSELSNRNMYYYTGQLIQANQLDLFNNNLTSTLIFTFPYNLVFYKQNLQQKLSLEAPFDSIENYKAILPDQNK